MMKYLLMLFLAGPASAACTNGGSPLNLEIPAIGAVGSEWAACVRRDLTKLSSSTVLGYNATFQSTTTTPTHKFVRFLTTNSFELGSINSAGLLSWSYGVEAASITATAYSSAPVVNTSTVSSPGSLRLYAGGGTLVGKLTDGVGAMFGGNGLTNSVLGNLDLIDSGGPTLYFRRNDTSVAAGEGLGKILVRDLDSSTGGSTVKSELAWVAAEGWASSNPMEVNAIFRFARQGGTLYDGMVITSSGVVISSAGAGFNAPTLPSTSVFHVNGNVSVSSSVQVSVLKFNDGTSMASASGLGTTASTYSFTTNGAFTVSVTASSLGACPSGSSVTVTLDGTKPYRAILSFSGQNASISRVTSSFICNGAFMSPFSSANVPRQATIEAGGMATDLGFDRVMPAPAAAQYTCCPTFATSGGTLVDATGGGMTSQAQFGIQEIRN